MINTTSFYKYTVFITHMFSGLIDNDNEDRCPVLKPDVIFHSSAKGQLRN